MIIGLSGYARSGKDTVAKTLIERYGYTRVAFADKIRDIVWDANPILKDNEFKVQGVVNAYGWDVAKTQFPELRRLLQAVGVAARDHLGDDVWISAAVKDLDPDKDYVITDVRFQNEANIIKNMGGQIWRVVRPGVEAINSHISESEMDSYEVHQVIMNDGDLESLDMLVSTRMRAYI